MNLPTSPVRWLAEPVASSYTDPRGFNVRECTIYPGWVDLRAYPELSEHVVQWHPLYSREIL